MTSMRRQEDRTPPPGIPAFRITVELPAAWQSYIANNVTDVFDDMDPDDPWNQAAADQEAAKLEKEGYAILGPVIGAEAEFGRHEGTLGAITTYEAVNHDVLASDDAAGMWRFRPAGSDTEYLILHGTEGVVWLPEHWRRKLADPACEIDECDIEWPDPAGDDPAQPPLTDLGEMPGDWDPRDRTPPPQDLEVWGEEAYERTAQALAARGWTLDQALDGSRLGWFHGQWGPLRPYVLTSEHDQEGRQRDPALGSDRQEAVVTAARRPVASRRVLRQARRAAAILQWRQAGASAAVIARGLGTDMRTIHRILADLRKRAGGKEQP